MPSLAPFLASAMLRGAMDEPTEPPSIAALLAVMARLRDRERGCPWDVEQSFQTIAPYTIEEAYEVAAAIEAGDLAALKDELGDLLFQVVFHARMAEEQAAFDFEDVAAGIVAKMVRRHPHVFGDQEVADAEAQTRHWEDLKAAERAAKAEWDDAGPASVLDGVALGLPALLRAVKLQRRAARVGFDWPEAAQVLDKIDEELIEIKDEIANNGSAERITDEVGDLLFAVANLARHLGADPEAALRHANAKFTRRFLAVEAAFGHEFDGVSLEDMEAAWQRAKREEG